MAKDSHVRSTNVDALKKQRETETKTKQREYFVYSVMEFYTCHAVNPSA